MTCFLYRKKGVMQVFKLIKEVVLMTSTHLKCIFCCECKHSPWTFPDPSIKAAPVSSQDVSIPNISGCSLDKFMLFSCVSTCVDDKLQHNCVIILLRCFVNNNNGLLNFVNIFTQY